MNPRLAAISALCQEVAIPASVLVWIVAFGSAGIDNTGAAPIVERPAPSVAAVANSAVAKLADKLPPISLAAADAVAAGRLVMETAAAEATPASHQPEPIVTAALTDSSEVLHAETPPDPIAKTSKTTEEPDNAGSAVESTKALDECSDSCIDHYL